MAIDHHNKPFDEETLVKLNLYQNYLREWLPVFIKSKSRRIDIYDFFCGPGKDLNGVKGSPLIALQVLMDYRTEIAKNRLQVHLNLNEFDKKKFVDLQKNVPDTNPAPGIHIHLSNLDFESSMRHHYPHMKGKSAKMLFLDQNGISQVNAKIFQATLALQKTDLLFFISSSYLIRFGERDEFQSLAIPPEILKDKKYFHCHRAVLDYYKGLVPEHMNPYLGQFTIKKGSNIYGLIFCSHHPLGMYKFVEVCWNQDPDRGEANFDIDSDKYRPNQGHLFEAEPKPTKIMEFEAELKEALEAKMLRTNLDVYKFSLERGCLPPRHAKPVLKKLVDQGCLAKVPSLGRDIFKRDPILLEFSG